MTDSITPGQEPWYQAVMLLRSLRLEIETHTAELVADRHHLALACRDAHQAGLSLSEIGRELGVTKSRVWNMIQELEG